ncbi:hypothetical protein FRC03_011750 [Tulasnella sp. 419]|nr:hypothetical protein FRC03_011750 [Tulasnella sp. 419]
MILRVGLLIVGFATSFTSCLPVSELPGSRHIEIEGFSTGIPLPKHLLDLVRARAIGTSKASWELGTLAQALLEIDWPQLSVYGNHGVPPPRSVKDNGGINNITSVLAVADHTIAIRPPGVMSLMQDGSSGDPASIGVPMLIANWTQVSRPDAWKNDYNTPLRQQMDYILNLAPKTPDGAISHRSEIVQLWSDSVFMVPPFIAYYGALHQPHVHSWLLYHSYEQIRLYRNYLYDPQKGLWKHIVGGPWGTDDGVWSTGNAWAAAGIMRVLLTINQTTVGHQPMFMAAQRNLQNWATEIVNNLWQHQQANGTLLNYPDDPNSFADSASTALLAAITYRLTAISEYLRGPPKGATRDPTVNVQFGATNVTIPPLVALRPDTLKSAHKARHLVLQIWITRN